MKSRTGTIRAAFTLVELLVVVAVIGLAMAMGLPTMLAAFKSGSDAQAVNVVTALCAASRNYAIQQAQYTCVHVQRNTGKGGGSYAAICIRNPATGYFGLAPGFDPQKLPGDMCLGEVSTSTVNQGTGKYNTGTANAPDNFTSFSIVFAPSGKVVTMVEGTDYVRFNTNNDPANNPAFYTTDPNIGFWDINLANYSAGGGNGEPGVTAITLFPYAEYQARLPDLTKVDTYLRTNGNFLPLNVYTGQFFDRSRR